MSRRITSPVEYPARVEVSWQRTDNGAVETAVFWPGKGAGLCQMDYSAGCGTTDPESVSREIAERAAPDWAIKACVAVARIVAEVAR